MIKIRAEITKRENKCNRKKTSETKRWLFEKINKIDNPLVRLIMLKKKERKHHLLISGLGAVTSLQILQTLKD